MHRRSGESATDKESFVEAVPVWHRLCFLSSEPIAHVKPNQRLRPSAILHVPVVVVAILHVAVVAVAILHVSVVVEVEALRMCASWGPFLMAALSPDPPASTAWMAGGAVCTLALGLVCASNYSYLHIPSQLLAPPVGVCTSLFSGSLPSRHDRPSPAPPHLQRLAGVAPPSCQVVCPPHYERKADAHQSLSLHQVLPPRSGAPLLQHVTHTVTFRPSASSARIHPVSLQGYSRLCHAGQ